MDIKKFKHGSEGTHSACAYMSKKYGMKVRCCECTGHVCTVDQPTEPIKIKDLKNREMFNTPETAFNGEQELIFGSFGSGGFADRENNQSTEPIACKCHCHNDLSMGCQCSNCEHGIGKCNHCTPLKGEAGGSGANPYLCAGCGGFHEIGTSCPNSLKGDWKERLEILVKEQSKNALEKNYAGEWCFFNRIDLIGFIAQELDTQKQEYIQRLEKEKIKEEKESDRLNELITQGDESERYFFNVTVGRLQAIDKAIELIKE